MKTIKPNFCYIGLDETEHWRIPLELRPYVARIYGIYAFDRNTHTNCCELTPSYWMECVDFGWVPSPACRVLCRAELDHIEEHIHSMLLDAPAHESSSYRHVEWVEDRIRHAAHCGFHEAGDLAHILDDDDLADPSTVLDALIEYWHANPKF